MKNQIKILVVSLCFVSHVAFAAKPTIVREDAESPFVSIAKSTFYGALLGSVVSVAIMLIASGDDDDIFKVGFVSGTALGLGYGIFHVATRPSAEDSASLFKLSPERRLSMGLPGVRVKTNPRGPLGADVRLFSWRF